MSCLPTPSGISIRVKPSIITAITLTIIIAAVIYYQSMYTAGATNKLKDVQDASKSIVSESAGINIAAEVKVIEQTEVPKRRLPDAIVVGAGKCGTDALITYLNTSDSFMINTIYRGDLKELNYYNHNYEKGVEWYIENMPPARSDQVIVEKCAPYLWNPVVPQKVYETKPDMKIVMVLCDPVKRLVSLYSHINSYKLVDGSDPLPSFHDIIFLENDILKENIHPRPAQPFLDSGKYSEFVQQWMEFFPRNQMVFISGEDLIADPLNEVKKVTSFLSKPDAVTDKNVYYDESRGYYCFRSHDDSQWCMDRSSKGRKHPELSTELLTALQTHFKPYNDKLEALVGLKFGWPKYFGKKS